MDFGRKISKRDQPQIEKKSRVSFVTTKDSPASVDTSLLEEDRRLVNWKKWLADRKKQSRHIESTTDRSPTDQLHCSSEKFRAFVEMRNLMEHAAIPVPVVPDKYRGGPEFWRTHEFLSDHGDASLPKLSLTFSRKDLNLPPDLTHVGLSDVALNERDLTGLKTEKDSWQRSEYLKTRKIELANEIARLQPKKPETAALIVQGRGFERKNLQPRIPPITITEAEDREESIEDSDQVAVLKIQDREFIWSKSIARTESVDIDPVTWSLAFTSEIDERVEREIILENKGTRVILYHWRNFCFRSNSIPLKIRDSPFFFNKTNGLIPPGQTVKIHVWYKSRARGVFVEFWRLITEPELSSEFVFRFWGCTSDTRNAQYADQRSIEKYLDCRIRDSAIRSIIEQIISSVQRSKPPKPPYKMLFLQADLFCSLNPSYFYHPSIVVQLWKMYCDVTVEGTPRWNLSLDMLRDILLQIEDVNYRRDMLTRFNNLCKQCCRLVSGVAVRSNKYDVVYNILCAFANLFEKENECVKNNSFIREKSGMKINRQEPIKNLSRKSSNNSQEICNGDLIDQSRQRKEKNFHLNIRLYREIFFIRIYESLTETIEQICAIIDSFNSLNESDR